MIIQTWQNQPKPSKIPVKSDSSLFKMNGKQKLQQQHRNKKQSQNRVSSGDVVGDLLYIARPLSIISETKSAKPKMHTFQLIEPDNFEIYQALTDVIDQTRPLRENLDILKQQTSTSAKIVVSYLTLV